MDETNRRKSHQERSAGSALGTNIHTENTAGHLRYTNGDLFVGVLSDADRAHGPPVSLAAG